MAVARMSHIRLVGLRREQNKIFESLTARGLFEPRATELKADAEPNDGGFYDALKLKQSRIAFALDFLQARHAAMAAVVKQNEAGRKKGNFDPAFDYELSPVKYGGGRMLITRADFSDAAAREFDLMHTCEELEKLSFAVVEAKSRRTAIESVLSQYEPYAALPIKLSEQARSGDVRIAVFYGKNASLPDLAGFCCAFSASDDGTAVVVSRKAVLPDIERAMSGAGFMRCPFDDDCTAAQKIEALSAEADDIDREIFNLTRSALAYEKDVKDLRILYDVVGLDLERAEAQKKFMQTDSAFLLEGWLPEAAAQEVVGETEQNFTVFVQLLAPEEKDAPPTLLVNKEILKPYEDVTNLYTAPKYGELDPNPVMSIFYFLFFGIMVGDAAYGLILAVAGLVLGICFGKKFDGGMRRLLLLVGMGGISAIIWGVLFGGYFSIDFGGIDIALWFNPMDDPIMLLALSVVLGCVQLVVAYIMKAVQLIRSGDPLSALLDCLPILLVFAAAGCLGLNMVLVAPPDGLMYAAAALGGTAVVMMLVFGGRKKKGIGKIFGGFGDIYGLINLVSDVLSYCRLFGLCLASAAIGMAFNTLGQLMFGLPGIGYVIGVILLIPLHMFNLALGVLGAYVHDARLQYLEFYGKFYSGGGRLFEPIGNKKKYTRYA